MVAKDVDSLPHRRQRAAVTGLNAEIEATKEKPTPNVQRNTKVQWEKFDAFITILYQPTRPAMKMKIRAPA
jgi:hypothetical protein